MSEDLKPSNPKSVAPTPKPAATPPPPPAAPKGMPPAEEQEDGVGYDPVTGDELDPPAKYDAKTQEIVVLTDADGANGKTHAIEKGGREHTIRVKGVLYQQSLVQGNGIVHYSPVPR